MTRGVPIHMLNHIPRQITANPTGSRIGGAAFITPENPWPRDRHGKRMQFVAQINLLEIPPRPYYKKDGLLQFFIADHGYYGIDDDDFLPPTNYANPHNREVRYIPASEYKNGKLEGGLRTQAKSIQNGYFRVAPVIYEQYPSPSDITFYNDLVEHGLLFEDALTSDLDERIHAGPKAIFGGGWAKFAQEDQAQLSFYNHTLLTLLPIRERTTNVKMAWGDSGIANFLMPLEDLQAWNFKNVLYYWDSY